MILFVLHFFTLGLARGEAYVETGSRSVDWEAGLELMAVFLPRLSERAVALSSTTLSQHHCYRKADFSVYPQVCPPLHCHASCRDTWALSFCSGSFSQLAK